MQIAWESAVFNLELEHSLIWPFFGITITIHHVWWLKHSQATFYRVNHLVTFHHIHINISQSQKTKKHTQAEITRSIHDARFISSLHFCFIFVFERYCPKLPPLKFESLYIVTLTAKILNPKMSLSLFLCDMSEGVFFLSCLALMLMHLLSWVFFRLSIYLLI